MLKVKEFRDLVGSHHFPAVSPAALSDLITAETRSNARRISKEIRMLCPKNPTKTNQNLRQLREKFLVESLIGGEPRTPYIELVDAIIESLREASEDPGSPDGSMDWKQVIKLAWERLQVSPANSVLDPNLIPFSHPRSFALAGAARWMSNAGYQFEIDDGHPVFSESERKRMVEAIEKLICGLGGHEVILRVLKLLKPHYDPKKQRYLHPVSFVQPSESEIRLPFPCNFIIHLAIKNLSFSPKSNCDSEDLWSQLEQLAKNFAAIYHVTPYGNWDFFFKDAYSLNEYIVDIALHDRFFRTRQLRSTDVPAMLEGLFDWLTEIHQRFNGWSIKSACRVAELILSKTPRTGPVVLSKKKLLIHCFANGIELSEAANILDVLTHKNVPNCDFVLPENPKTITFGWKPLIRVSEDELYLVDRAFCAPAFYEAIAMPLRQLNKNTQSEIGFASERLLRGWLESNGVSVLDGEHDFENKTLECDGVIVTDECVIFVEQKGKPLTDAAQSGSDFEILNDLLQSFLDSIYQAYRHEIALRKQGHICLRKKDGSEFRVELGEKSVEKICVSLLDFGSFNDRSAIMQLLEILPNALVDSITPAAAGKSKKLNSKTADLRIQLDTLSALIEKSRRGHDPILSTWFLSIPQLMILADGVSSNEGFKNKLWETRHLSFQCLDWYTESTIAERIKSIKS